MGNKQSQTNSFPSQQNKVLIQSEARSLPSFDPSGKEPSYKDDEPINEKPDVSQEALTSKEVEDATKLSLSLKKKIIQSSSFSSQTFPMLVSLHVQNLKKTAKAPLDLVCVIDHSGSMEGEKIKLVKETFNYLLTYLEENDRLSIVIFDHTVQRLFPLMRTNKNNKEKILGAVKTISANGGTDINKGLIEAFHILQQRRYQNPVSSIFLLSDGLDGGAQTKVKTSLNQMNVSEEITIHTFGFGSDHDPQLMNDIAALRDGNFYFIKQLDTIDEAFVDCLGGLLGAVGQNITIKIQPGTPAVLPGITITKAYGDPAMWNKESDTFITKVSTLMAGAQKDFVLELSLPPQSKELLDHEKVVKVANAQAEFVALNGDSIIKTADLEITLLNETEEIKEEEEDDKDVMKNFFRLKGAMLMNDAKKLADQGKYEEAKKMLNSFKEELEHSFLKDEQFIKNLIKDIDQAVQNVNPIVYQEIGKHAMLENARAQMYQKSNLASANCYQTSMQSDMITKVRAMKSKK